MYHLLQRTGADTACSTSEDKCKSYIPLLIKVIVLPNFRGFDHAVPRFKMMYGVYISKIIVTRLITWAMYCEQDVHESVEDHPDHPTIVPLYCRFRPTCVSALPKYAPMKRKADSSNAKAWVVEERGW